MTRPAERADARRNRARLLSAAREVFAERGVGAEIREICERSGIGVATLYRNFATKEDLITAISSEAFAEIEAIVEAASAEPDPRAAVELLIVGAFGVVERYHELARAVSIIQEHYNEPEPPGGLQDSVVALLARAQEAGLARRDLEPRQLLEVLDAVIITYMRLTEAWPLEAAREAVLRMTWAGFAEPPLAG